MADASPPQELLYDVPYQVLRLKLIPYWTTVSGAERNGIRLLRYVGRAKTPYGKALRVWRSMKAIEAAKKTLDERDLKAPSKVCARLLRGHQLEFERYVAKRGWGTGAPPPGTLWKPLDWSNTRKQLEKLWWTNAPLFDTLQRHYEGRAYNNPNHDFSRIRTNPTLARFLRLIRDVRYEMETGKIVNGEGPPEEKEA